MREEIMDIIEENMNDLKENSSYESTSTIEEKIAQQNEIVRKNEITKKYLEEIQKESIEDLTEEEAIILNEKLGRE